MIILRRDHGGNKNECEIFAFAGIGGFGAS